MDNDLIRRKDVMWITCQTGAIETAIRVRELPAVDAEPVRHGKCDFCGRGKPIKAYTYLPDCGLQYGIAVEAIYCPKCGEKMDAGTHDA